MTVVAGRPREAGFVSSVQGASAALKADVSRAQHNADSAGLSHFITSAENTGEEIPEMSNVFRGCWRMVDVDGRGSFLEVAFVANLVADLHPPSAGCFETYEVLPTDLLVTPDVDLEVESLGTLICGFAPLGSLDETPPKGKDLRLKVSCSARPGYPSTKVYALSSIAKL